MLATAKLLLSKFMYFQNKEETKQHVTKIGSQLDEVISQVRRVSRNLVPQVLVEFGLVAALEELCSRINEGDGIRTHLSTCDESIPLSGVEQLAIYRIVQEFCNNTIRHSGAKNIWIDYSIGQGYVQYTLRDDGRGIERDRLTGLDGLGINNMKARAKSIGAHIVLDNGQINGVVMSIKLSNEL
jgi:signal transduction histidine kinase